MRALRRRRAIAEAARAAGLGDVIRVHRQHSAPLALPLVVLIVPGIAATVASLALRMEHSLVWQWPLFAWAALLGVAYVWVHVGPLRGGRRWVAVAEGGLVLWSRHSVQTVPWGRTGAAGAAILDGLCNVRDVRKAIRRRGRVSAWTWRRITGLAVTGLVTAPAVWFLAVPLVLPVFIGYRPTHVAQFVRICQGGSPFGRTAAYAGPPPHPIVAFAKTEGTDNFISYLPPDPWAGGVPYPNYVGDSRPNPHSKPDATQLVGCAQIIGTKDHYSCKYDYGHIVELYHSQYRLDIYEARTGRLVTSVSVDSSRSGGCHDEILVPRNADPMRRHRYVGPDDEGFRAVLDPLMNGRVK